MVQYSITDLEKITGIKAHTIRMWERRYDLIQPDRTTSNVRLYSQNDMQRLQDVVLLYNKGVKISQIASMEDTERASMLQKLGISDNNLELRKDCFTASILEFNEEKLTTLIDNYERRHGFIKTLTDYVWPHIENSSLLYVSGAFNLAHENFINQVVKRKIMAHIDEIPYCDCGSRGQVLLFLPPGENKELYTAGIEYTCRFNGFDTLNLGMNIGPDELQDFCLSVDPDYIVTMVDVDFKLMAVLPFVEKIRCFFPESEIILCGHQASTIRTPLESLTIFSHPTEVFDYFS